MLAIFLNNNASDLSNPLESGVIPLTALTALTSSDLTVQAAQGTQTSPPITVSQAAEIGVTDSAVQTCESVSQTAITNNAAATPELTERTTPEGFPSTPPVTVSTSVTNSATTPSDNATVPLVWFSLILTAEHNAARNTIDYSLLNPNVSPGYYGMSFHLHRFVNGKWEMVQINDNVSFPAIGYQLEAGSRTERKIDIEFYFGELKPGTYRLCKCERFPCNESMMSNTFEIK
jgi:hypothetical protein